MQKFWSPTLWESMMYKDGAYCMRACLACKCIRTTNNQPTTIKQILPFNHPDKLPSRQTITPDDITHHQCTRHNASLNGESALSFRLL